MRTAITPCEGIGSRAPYIASVVGFPNMIPGAQKKMIAVRIIHLQAAIIPRFIINHIVAIGIQSIQLRIQRRTIAREIITAHHITEIAQRIRNLVLLRMDVAILTVDAIVVQRLKIARASTVVLEFVVLRTDEHVIPVREKTTTPHLHGMIPLYEIVVR